jgi:hypothetical protein
VWRFTMSLLCLIAALAGSPLRQVEAAGDLARSLAELDGGDVFEAVDGGVGDDAGETIPSAIRRSYTDRMSDSPAIDDGPGPSMRAPAPPSTGGDNTRPLRTTRRPTPPPARRYAWLQAFRF